MLRHGFSGRGGALELRVDALGREALTELLGQLIELIEPEPARIHDDPLAQIVGIAEEAHRPEDPALLRLLPDGYRDDDAASADFRRFTERSLRQQKAAHARAAIATLERTNEKGHVTMTPEEGQAWLLALNDIRLAMGTRLGITQDDEARPGGLPVIYDWLTWLQSTLVDALMPKGRRLR